MSFDHTPHRKSHSPAQAELSKRFCQTNPGQEEMEEPATEIIEQNSIGQYDEAARFELLSAYVDNEVSAEERRLVAQWLTDEPDIQKTYRQLLMLRQALRMTPVPEQPMPQVPSLASRQTASRSCSSMLRQAIVYISAIALLTGFGSLLTASGRQQIQEALQFIKSLPQSSLIELALETTEAELPRRAIR